LIHLAVDEPMKAHELSEADRAEGWGEQLQEWLASDEYRHHARRRILDQIYRYCRCSE
jgi:hypothetical protein